MTTGFPIRPEHPPGEVQAAARRELRRLWQFNRTLGPSERTRGLHYWLGYEYALILALTRTCPGQTWLDVGAGAHSVMPYAFAHRNQLRVIGLDRTDRLAEQIDRGRRACRHGLVAAGQVHWVRGDARTLPMPDASLDGVLAVSALEHLTDGEDDAVALREVHRVLRPGGRAVVTVPFRSRGSMIELHGLQPFQRHYSPATLAESFVRPSGLAVESTICYGERLPFYALTRRLPSRAHRLLILRRPRPQTGSVTPTQVDPRLL
ncbi:methyltransferase family protein [Micromonospora sp. Llam0]|uniref:class I SAM-dependent methyltransferase n=1 Tax=Micromonospora sp. Llam0 TaxID=2485143 RepID=UPI000F497E51|nr:class I SAM-dependent methyltransferase [Micromonospora sp. Llam0]ROO63116.1 methyltransferase family protein [Micromonospora sp. Llam0]